jgi:hypothetical protein
VQQRYLLSCCKLDERTMGELGPSAFVGEPGLLKGLQGRKVVAVEELEVGEGKCWTME